MWELYEVRCMSVCGWWVVKVGGKGTEKKRPNIDMPRTRHATQLYHSAYLVLYIGLTEWLFPPLLCGFFGVPFTFLN
jgi:hypothetical protein